jgi:hypothetical protein
MKPSSEILLARVLVLAVLLVNAVGLWPEIAISRVDLNDNVFHFALVERMVQAVDRGENPLDCWSPEWSLGYPVLRTYQPLAHALVAAAYFALGKSIGLMTIFVWARFLSVVLLPLSFFAAARLMGLAPLTAAASAILAPLISTNFLYGVEYNSYTWAGSGLFPQAVGSHFLLFTLGLSWRAIHRGRLLVLTGVLLGLTFLAHLIYGYMGALSVCLLALIPDAEVTRGVRIRRVAVVGAAAVLLSAFQLAPLLLDGANINHSRWEAVWKWDSFGAGQVLKWLFTGDLLDFGRLPVLTLLAFAGSGLFAWNWYKRQPRCPVHAYALWGAGFWTLMFFGRPLWGPLLTMLGVSADMQLHRVIGGAQIFLVLLGAIALGALWREVSRRSHYAVAGAVTVLLLYPMVRDRARVLANDAAWGEKSLAAYASERQALDATIAAVKQRGGRAYSGLAASWGGKFKLGDVQVYAFFSTANIPAVAFLYHSMALTGDTMVRFNDWNPSHYRLFNIRTVVAPAGADPAIPTPVLTPIGQNGRFRLFDAPPSSYFDVVDVLASVKATRNNFYDINDRWLQSDWVAKRLHLRLDWRDNVSPPISRMAPEDPLMSIGAPPPPGEVRGEYREGEVYRADLEAFRDSFALFKMTWHANWKAYVDGKPQDTAMLSPGFVGVPLTPGRHSITMRYEPSSWKTALGFAGLLGVAILFGMERQGWLARAEAAASEWTLPDAARRRLLIASGLILLAVPVCTPLFCSSVLWGHDAFVYFPRLEEFDQSITHGVMLPRWAPDLGRGTGQPLFIFSPPMFYYFGEVWRLLGFDFVTAVNLACVLVVMLSAVTMFLLARLYFGDAGGWLGAAAYLYAPYFAIDLYVRSALAEFAAFPFFALALYGFGAYAKYQRTRHWVIGVIAYACVLFCHFPAALIFTPVLLGLLCVTVWMEKSWTVAWRQASGFLLGLGLSALVWVPGMALRQYVAMNRAVEGYGRYSNHLVYLHQLFYSPWGYGTSVAGPDDGMSFALGWSHLLLIVVAWVWISRNPGLGDRRLLRFFGFAGAALCIVMLQESEWFWDHAPLLQYAQYPWRLLGPVAICTAMLIASLGRPLLSVALRWRALAITAAMALLIVPNLSHLHSKQPVDVDLGFSTPRQLSVRGFDVTAMGEVSPRWMTAPPAYSPFAARVRSGDAEFRQPLRTAFDWSSSARSKVASIIEMQTAWFPGWEVRVDGRPVLAGPGLSGLITFALPPGDHMVNVRYGRTATEKLAAAVSMGSLILMLVLARFGSAWPRSKP